MYLIFKAAILFTCFVTLFKLLARALLACCVEIASIDHVQIVRAKKVGALEKSRQVENGLKSGGFTYRPIQVHTVAVSA